MIVLKSNMFCEQRVTLWPGPQPVKSMLARLC